MLTCLLSYLGGPLFVCLSTGVVFFTVTTYFLLLQLQVKGRFDSAVCSLVVSIMLGLLAINMAAENLLQEVRLTAVVAAAFAIVVIC